MVHAVARRKRHTRVAAVDGAGRGIHEVLHALSAAPFQHISEPNQVRVNIGLRASERVSYAGLRRQVHDHGKGSLFKKPRHSLAIGEVHLEETESGPALELCQPRLLDVDVVIGVKIVQTHQGPPLVKETFREMKSDEPRAPRY